MGLEVATFISGLNVNNPVGATDPKSQGDDHLRLIKATLLNTFPNISGAMNVSHTELNNLVGVTGKTGSGNIVFSNAPTFTGLISGLAGSGANLTALNASNISSGILADARLSANVPRLNSQNIWTQLHTWQRTIIANTYDETDAGVNERIWEHRITIGTWTFAVRSDALGAPIPFFTVERTGTNVDSIDLAAGSITANGSPIITEASLGAGDGLTKIGSSLAVNNTVVRTTGAQSIDGAKTFLADIALTGTRAIDASIRLNLTGATVGLGELGGSLGFYGAVGVTQRIVTGSRGGNLAFANLLNALDLMGLIDNQTAP